MFHNKKKSLLILIWCILGSNYAFAEQISVGSINYKEPINQTVQEQDDSEKRNVGKIKINENKKNDFKMIPPSKDGEIFLKEMETLSLIQKEKDYEKSLDFTNNLLNKYPNNVILLKWKAIYENKTQRFNNSIDTLNKLFLTYPLDKDITNTFEFYYILLDNYRSINDIENYNNVKNKINHIFCEEENLSLFFSYNKNISTINKNKQIIKILLDYQDLLINNLIDETIITKLWMKYHKKIIEI